MILTFFRKTVFFAITLAGAFSGLHAASVGVVDIDVAINAVPIKISGDSAETRNLMIRAFNTHGKFRPVTSGHRYELRFTSMGESAKVEVLYGSGRLHSSEVVQGTSQNNALMRAGDSAVRTLLGQPGYFSSQLVFVGEREGGTDIYISDLLFTEVRRLTNNKAQCVVPRWSPDGRKIIYTSYHRGGLPDIYLINLQTRQRTTFMSLKGTNTAARFSPDGSRVAMVLSAGGNPDIYISNVLGRNLSRRTNTPNTVEASPCWSPDGTRLVFTSDASGGPQLYVMSANGGSASRLPTNISRYCAEPDWSLGNPDKIAFTIRQGRGFQVAVYDMARRQTQPLVTRAPLDGINPSWLIDGRHIVYTERSANKRSLWLWDSETGKRTRLSPESFGSASEAHVWIGQL